MQQRYDKHADAANYFQKKACKKASASSDGSVLAY
jgi:hypothetical protein